MKHLGVWTFYRGSEERDGLVFRSAGRPGDRAARAGPGQILED